MMGRWSDAERCKKKQDATLYGAATLHSRLGFRADMRLRTATTSLHFCICSKDTMLHRIESDTGILPACCKEFQACGRGDAGSRLFSCSLRGPC